MKKKADITIAALMQAIALIRNEEEATQFFTDLCTPCELESMADRWQVVPLLCAATSYRMIHEQTGVSIATITRIARCIKFGSGGYRLIAERMQLT